MPMKDLTDTNRFYFSTDSQLLVTFGVKNDRKNFILNHIRTYSGENTLFSNIFMVKFSIEEIITNTTADYSDDFAYGGHLVS
jgi:hypothetical protein